MLRAYPVFADVARTEELASAPALEPSPFGALLVGIRPGSRPAPASTLQLALLEPSVDASTPALFIRPAEAEKLSSSPAPQASVSEDRPLPPPRPSALGWSADHGAGSPAPTRKAGQADRNIATGPSDDRTLFEKFFGALQPSEPKAPSTTLAYAAPETGVLNDARTPSAVSPRYDRWTAIYDISAHMVYLPDGTKLEAHSGLGDKLDDPRYVHVRMRGATPPHVYDLSMRERLFHGVAAIRLTPVGGEGSIFGRAGLLAHTYMLGPRGDSNGCVSFKNYNAFLRAFQSGEIKRLVVVARMG